MEDLILQTSQNFSRVLAVVSEDLATIRTGRASAQLLENLSVSVYNTKMKLLELATIAAVDPTTLLVTPFDLGNISAVAHAIQEANLGVSAFVEDTNIRVVVPPLSHERRSEYVKLAKSKVEGGKVMIRQARHEAMDEVVKMTADEDTKDRLEKEIQNATEAASEKLDLMFSQKEKELLTV